MRLTHLDPDTVWYQTHQVSICPAEALIIEVALTELTERLNRGTANSGLERATIDLWMKSRMKGGGIHESNIDMLNRDVKEIVKKILRGREHG